MGGSTVILFGRGAKILYSTKNFWGEKSLWGSMPQGIREKGGFYILERSNLVVLGDIFGEIWAFPKKVVCPF